MLYSLAGILLFSAAHIVRDGTPSLGSTFLARITAAVICLGAAQLIIPQHWPAAAIGSAIGLGFWTDHEHATGQRMRSLDDAKYMLASGLTSLAPAFVTACLLQQYRMAGALAIVSASKPALWLFAWKTVPLKLQPTRVAAGVFGAVIGVAICYAR